MHKSEYSHLGCYHADAGLDFTSLLLSYSAACVTLWADSSAERGSECFAVWRAAGSCDITFSVTTVVSCFSRETWWCRWFPHWRILECLCNLSRLVNPKGVVPWSYDLCLYKLKLKYVWVNCPDQTFKLEKNKHQVFKVTFVHSLNHFLFEFFAD